MENKKIQYDAFVMRQFRTSFVGTNLSKVDQDGLLTKLNIAYDNRDEAPDRQLPNDDSHYSYESFLFEGGRNNIKLVDSKWDFCKYLVVPNDNDCVKQQVMRITTDVYQFIRSGYSSRNENELAVLSRWLELPVEFDRPKAKYVVAILYSYKQLFAEFLKTAKVGDKFALTEDCEYGIVAIMGTPDPEPDPMLPVTMFRNGLGMEYGGNSTKLDTIEYNKGVEFWSKHILVK